MRRNETPVSSFVNGVVFIPLHTKPDQPNAFLGQSLLCLVVSSDSLFNFGPRVPGKTVKDSSRKACATRLYRRWRPASVSQRLSQGSLTLHLRSRNDVRWMIPPDDEE